MSIKNEAHVKQTFMHHKFYLNDICFGADECNAAILAVHQHLSPKVLTQQILRDISSLNNQLSAVIL